MKILYAMVGAAGRMGRTIVALAADLRLKGDSLQLAGALEQKESPHLGEDAGELAGIGSTGVKLTSDRQAALAEASVVIDFSSPESSLSVVEYCRLARKACLVGATGHTPKQRAQILAAAADIPLLAASNTSIGVNLLFALARMATLALPADNFDVEVMEIHHRYKKDAPSGTALSLQEVWEQASAHSQKSVSFGRQGSSLVRSAGEIGIHAVRGGDVAGDHTVFFLGNGERLELTHRATSRNAFALGALRAAHFLAEGSREPGLYTMNDALQLGI